MPYYDYRCLVCGEKFSERQTFEEHDRHKRVKCPKCESRKIERTISPVYAQTSKKS